MLQGTLVQKPTMQALAMPGMSGQLNPLQQQMAARPNANPMGQLPMTNMGAAGLGHTAMPTPMGMPGPGASSLAGRQTPQSMGITGGGNQWAQYVQSQMPGAIGANMGALYNAYKNIPGSQNQINPNGPATPLGPVAPTPMVQGGGSTGNMLNNLMSIGR